MDYRAILDPYVGIIQGVHPVPSIPGEPSALRCFSASVADLGRVLQWAPDSMGTGFSFTRQSARLAAIGEAIERYSGNCPEKETVVASIDDLKNSGVSYYDPLATPMFLPSQYQHPRFPFKQLTSADVIEWVTGEDLTPTRGPVLLPAALVYLNYYRTISGRSYPRHFSVLMSGIAAGQDKQAACLSALLEIIERDATMLWWHASLSAQEIDIPGDSNLRRTLLDGVDAPTELRLLLLPSDHPVCVVAAVLINEPEDVLVLGSSARPDAASAVLKATAEAFQLRRVALALRDPESWLWASRAAGLLRYPARPFRADLRYRDSFEADFSDMTQLAHNAQYYLDRRAWDDALQRLSGRPVRLDDIRPGVSAKSSPARQVDALTRHLASAGMRAYLCDVSTTDILRCGARVVRVLVPEAMGNNPSAIPMLGNPRLREQCAHSGQPPCLLPLPHS